MPLNLESMYVQLANYSGMQLVTIHNKYNKINKLKKILKVSDLVLHLPITIKGTENNTFSISLSC